MPRNLSMPKFDKGNQRMAEAVAPNPAQRTDSAQVQSAGADETVGSQQGHNKPEGPSVDEALVDQYEDDQADWHGQLAEQGSRAMYTEAAPQTTIVIPGNSAVVIVPQSMMVIAPPQASGNSFLAGFQFGMRQAMQGQRDAERNAEMMRTQMANSKGTSFMKGEGLNAAEQFAAQPDQMATSEQADPYQKAQMRLDQKLAERGMSQPEAISAPGTSTSEGQTSEAESAASQRLDAKLTERGLVGPEATGNEAQTADMQR